MKKHLLLSLFLALIACGSLRAEESDIRMADGATFTVGDYEYIFNPNGATLRSVDILRHLDLTAAEIDVPATVEYGSVEFDIHGIREGAFNSHFNLEKVNIAEGIINLMPCFADCPKLQRLDLPASIAAIPAHFLKGTAIKELYIADLKGVGEYAFSNDCLETLQIDKCTQTVLRDYSFARTNLEEIVVPENIEYITHYVFAYNKKLRKVKLGSKIKSLGELIFYGCKNLVTMELAAPTPPRLDYEYWPNEGWTWICDTFYEVHSGCSIYWEPWFIVIPKESIPVYQASPSGEPYGYWRGQRYYALEDGDPQLPEPRLEITETSINMEIGSLVPVAAGIPKYWYEYMVNNYDSYPSFNWEITDESIIEAREPISWEWGGGEKIQRISGKHRYFLALKEGECDIIVTVKQFPELKAVCHVSTRPSGVNGVELEELPQDVYNLQGVRVKANATKADIDALPAGIYIIGGKQIVKTN